MVRGEATAIRVVAAVVAMVFLGAAVIFAMVIAGWGPWAESVDTDGLGGGAAPLDTAASPDPDADPDPEPDQVVVGDGPVVFSASRLRGVPEHTAWVEVGGGLVAMDIGCTETSTASEWLATDPFSGTGPRSLGGGGAIRTVERLDGESQGYVFASMVSSASGTAFEYEVDACRMLTVYASRPQGQLSVTLVAPDGTSFGTSSGPDDYPLGTRMGVWPEEVVITFLPHQAGTWTIEVSDEGAASPSETEIGIYQFALPPTSPVVICEAIVDGDTLILDSSRSYWPGQQDPEFEWSGSFATLQGDGEVDISGLSPGVLHGVTCSPDGYSSYRMPFHFGKGIPADSGYATGTVFTPDEEDGFAEVACSAVIQGDKIIFEMADESVSGEPLESFAWLLPFERRAWTRDVALTIPEGAYLRTEATCAGWDAQGDLYTSTIQIRP